MAERNLTSIDKAFDVCEALSKVPRGANLRDLARTLGLPAPTLHRMLAVLKRRGYVRQDEETQRYSLTLKMLDVSFQLLGRSEIRLHAYPVLREYALKAGVRSFLAVSATDEVTYVWSSGPDEVSMRTVYGRTMPAHCSLYFSAAQATRRLSCLKLPAHGAGAVEAPERLGLESDAPAQRLCCTCAAVHDYTGREVARVGVFAHRHEDAVLGMEFKPAALDLARAISVRLGHLPAATMSITA